MGQGARLEIGLALRVQLIQSRLQIRTGALICQGGIHFTDLYIQFGALILTRGQLKSLLQILDRLSMRAAVDVHDTNTFV
jgi:hypothetical protein